MKITKPALNKNDCELLIRSLYWHRDANYAWIRRWEESAEPYGPPGHYDECRRELIRIGILIKKLKKLGA